MTGGMADGATGLRFLDIKDGDVEREVLPGKGMVSVQDHRIGFDFDHPGLHAVRRANLGTDLGLRRHILLRHRDFFLFVVGPVPLRRRNGDALLVPGFQAGQCLLQGGMISWWPWVRKVGSKSGVRVPFEPVLAA